MKDLARKRDLVAFIAGLLFGVGLLLSGMTDPNNVIGFLDVFGHWNPRLAFVMVGAIAVHAPIVAIVRRRGAPLLAARLFIPTRREIDAALVGGAAMFGIGWGMSGYCPGPSLVALPSVQVGVVVFVAAFVFGSWLERLLFAAAPTPPSEASPTA
jgi:uncharacterized membrane protein YedE/YeeE